MDNIFFVIKIENTKGNIASFVEKCQDIDLKNGSCATPCDLAVLALLVALLHVLDVAEDPR